MDPVPTRTCTKCGKTYPATTEFFFPHKRYKYGLYSWCKNCKRDYHREWWHQDKARDPEAHLSKQRALYRKHREKRRASARKFYREHPGAAREYTRKRRMNAEKLAHDRARHREWNQLNREYIRKYRRVNRDRINAQRRARRADRSIELREKQYKLPPGSIEQMLVQQKGQCLICHRALVISTVCVDHNHKTGKVRGLLCRQCNGMLGHARDEHGVFHRAIEYLISQDQ